MTRKCLGTYAKQKNLPCTGKEKLLSKQLAESLKSTMTKKKKTGKVVSRKPLFIQRTTRYTSAVTSLLPEAAC